MIKVIGIDPGLAATGIGLVYGKGLSVAEFAHGSIHTHKSRSMPERLYHIHSGLSQILKEERPDLMVVEAAFSLDKYPKSGITLGKVIGVILLAGQTEDVPVIEIPVREAKQILTGNGSASKHQLERSVRHALNATEPIKPFHASDALALALIGLFRYRDKSLGCGQLPTRSLES